MAITVLKEIPIGQSNTYTGDFRKSDFKEEVRVVKKFLARTDSEYRTHHHVITEAQASGTTFLAEGFPFVWDPHPDNSDWLVKDFQVEYLDASKSREWRAITVSYALFTNPLEEPAVISIDKWSEMRVVEGAYGNSPIPNANIALTADGLIPLTNSAGDPFDPAYELPEWSMVIKVKKNLSKASFDPQTIERDYVRRINADTVVVTAHLDPTAGGLHVFDIEPRKLLLPEPPSATPQYKSNVGYWETEWTFRVKSRGWSLKPADLGFRTANYATGVRSVIYLGGQPAQNPQKLNGFGAQASLNAAPVYLEYQVYDTVDLNQLPIWS